MCASMPPFQGFTGSVRYYQGVALGCIVSVFQAVAMVAFVPLISVPLLAELRFWNLGFRLRPPSSAYSAYSAVNLSRPWLLLCDA